MEAGAAVAEISHRPASRARDHRFFAWMAGICALIVFAGFARTYYLAPLFDTPPSTQLVHVHGFVATLWIVLFVSQVSLVLTHRTAVHRRLGIAGGALALLLIVVGYVTAIEAARLGRRPAASESSLVFLVIPLSTLVVFGIFVAAGLSARRQPETHKRLMLLGTIALLPPALARLGRLFELGGPPTFITVTCLLVLACLVHDWRTHGRVHPAFLWGGLFLIASIPIRFVVGRSEAWQGLAAWLIG